MKREFHGAEQAGKADCMGMTGYTVEALRPDESVASLESDWNRLSRVARDPNVFTTYAWFRAWHERMACESKPGMHLPHVLVLRRNNVIVGIVPLVLETSERFGFRVRRLEFVTRADYNELVVGDGSEEQLDAVFEYLLRTREQWDVLDLSDVRNSSDSLTKLKSALRRAGLAFEIEPEEERCPYMKINGTWEEMLARRSPSTRRRFRLQQSRLAKLNGPQVRARIIENPKSEPGLLERMIAVEARKVVGGEPAPPFLAKYPDVFEKLLADLGERGWLAIALLEQQELLLSWHLLYRCGDKLWGYLTAFDFEYARYSPGTMLIPAVIDYGYAHGFTEYDFLSGEEPYKQQWANEYHRTYRVKVWSRCWNSRIRSFAWFHRPGDRSRSVGAGN